MDWVYFDDSRPYVHTSNQILSLCCPDLPSAYHIGMNPSPFLPVGFRCCGIHAGFKSRPEHLDLALIVAEAPCSAAGVFTRNHFPGEPVKLARERLRGGKLQALIINSRISNVGTGARGRAQAEAVCESLSRQLGIASELSLISSTGIIGRPYPEGVFEKAIPKALSQLGQSEEHLMCAARAIMTTDTVPKIRQASVGGARICAIAKGAGMIAPNMATLLVFILTDARLPETDIQPMLVRVVDKSFNCISVDFDTSTSDSCFLMSSGKSSDVSVVEFEPVLTRLCQELARDIVADGEGVTHTIRCEVRLASDAAQARSVASSISNSLLVKTMITGADPNWGRLLMAIGKVSDPRLAGVKPSLAICDESVMLCGEPVAHDASKISRRMREEKTVPIVVDLHLGQEAVVYWGANLTAEYVAVNADYTT